MLRRQRFSRIETVILSILAGLILAAGLAGLFLGIDRVQWRLVLTGIGTLVIGAVYLLAAKRGKPL